MELEKILSFITYKDWVIIITVGILIIALFQIRRLKRSLILEIQKRLIPDLIFDIDLDDVGLYIKNIGSMVARNIAIEDLDIDIEDYGFLLNFKLIFDPIDSLRPNERIKVNFKAYRRGEQTPTQKTEGFAPHLVSVTFRLIVNFSNIENIKFRSEFLSKGKKFVLERIEYLQQYPTANLKGPSGVLYQKN